MCFSDGETFRLPAELLRVFSPAANNIKLRPSGGKVGLKQGLAGGKLDYLWPLFEKANLQVVAGRKHVGIMGIEAVGNYAIRLQFDDLHGSGLYHWPMLYDLGLHKVAYIRRYLLMLKADGLSRRPKSGTRNK